MGTGFEKLNCKINRDFPKLLKKTNIILAIWARKIKERLRPLLGVSSVMWCSLLVTGYQGRPLD